MKALRNAGIAIVIYLILQIAVFAYILSATQLPQENLQWYPFLFLNLISIILLVIVLLGIIKLGKKTNSNLIIYTFAINIIFVIVYSLLFIQQDIIKNILSLIVSITTIILGFAFFKLNKIKLAKVSGILLILSGILLTARDVYYLIIFSNSSLLTFNNIRKIFPPLSNIGELIAFVTQIILAIMFFSASKRFENKK